MKVSDLYKWFQDFFGSKLKESFPKSLTPPSLTPKKPNIPTLNKTEKTPNLSNIPTPSQTKPTQSIPSSQPQQNQPIWQLNPPAPPESVGKKPTSNNIPPGMNYNFPNKPIGKDPAQAMSDFLGKLADNTRDVNDIFNNMSKSFNMDYLKNKSRSKNATPEDKEEYSIARTKQLWKSSKNFGDSLHKMATTDDPYEMGKSAAAGVQNLGKMIGGKVGRGIEMIGKFAELTIKVQEAMTKFGDNLISVNTRFAEFSASMTRVQVVKEMADMRLSQQKGEARAESAKLLTEEKIKFDKSWAVVENVFAIAANNTAAAFYRIFNTLSGNTNSNTTPNPGFGQELGNAARTDWTETYGQPQNFQRIP